MKSPVRFLRRSGPVRRVTLRETPLKLQEALSVRRTFPGWLTFVTGW